MHLGNVYAALMSWLSVKTSGGEWVLRIEDLDPGRSRREYAELIEDDLRWLGLNWDEGGLENRGSRGPYCQSLRDEVYRRYFSELAEKGLLYRCSCRRADILATQAPHQSDGRIVYSGRCRPAVEPPFHEIETGQSGAIRLWVPDRDIRFEDMVAGEQTFNLARDCGDFVVRRSDGAWAYQLAVVVDDALMGITEVVRGDDLLLSTAQQIYIYRLLGFEPPRFGHFPLLCNEAGQRLSKRDGALSMEVLRNSHKPEQIIGRVARLAKLIDRDEPLSTEELLQECITKYGRRTGAIFSK